MRLLDWVSSTTTRARYALGVSPIAFIFLPLISIPDVGDFLTALLNLVADIASMIVSALVSAVGLLFATGTETFLFFPPPSEIPGLTAVWSDFAFLYFALLPVSGAMFFLTMQIFPENQEADIYRFMERTLAATIALIVTSPTLANFTSPHTPGSGIDLFSAAVYLVNQIGMYVFPADYSLQFLTGNLNGLMGSMVAATAGVGAVGAIVGIAFIGTTTILGVALTIAFFYLVLAMRMVLVYSVYAMMPLLLALWIVDIGPMKYGKTVASLVFKVTAVLLLFGIIVSAILATTQAIADPATTDTVAFSSMTYSGETEMLVENGSVNGSVVEGSGGGAGNATSGAFQLLFLRLFAWVSGIVLSVAITTSALGMLISTHGSSGTARRIRQGRRPDAGGARSFSTGGAGGLGGGGGGGGGGGAAGGGGGSTMGSVGYDADSDTAFVQSDQGGAAIDEDSVSTFEPSAPENVDAADGIEGAPLKDKAKYAGSQAAGKAKSGASWADEKATGGKIGGAKDSAKQSVSRKAEAAKDISAEDVGSGVESAGKKVGGKISDNEQRVEAVSEKAGAAAEKGTEIASSAASRAGSFGKSAASGAKRGAKAYGSVLKQPTMGESIGEAHRIARASPIANPNKKSPGEKTLEEGAKNPVVANEMAGEFGETSEWKDSAASGEVDSGGLDEPDVEEGDGSWGGSVQRSMRNDDPMETSEFSENTTGRTPASQDMSPSDTGVDASDHDVSGEDVDTSSGDFDMDSTSASGHPEAGHDNPARSASHRSGGYDASKSGDEGSDRFGKGSEPPSENPDMDDEEMAGGSGSE